MSEEIDALENETMDAEDGGEKVAAACPRCGYGAEKPMEPLQDDLEEYMRCVLGGQRFMKTYSMYDGKVKLTFRSLVNKEVDHLNGLLFTLSGRDDDPAAQDMVVKAKLLFFLAAADLSGKGTEYDVPMTLSVENLSDVFNERLGDCPEPIIRIMVQTLGLFTEVQGLLVNAGFDSNFWKGAGLR